MKNKIIAIAAAAFLLATSVDATAHDRGKRKGPKGPKHAPRAYNWQTDADGRVWREGRNGTRIWRDDDKRVKRNINRGGNLNNGDNGDRNNRRTW